MPGGLGALGAITVRIQRSRLSPKRRRVADRTLVLTLAALGLLTLAGPAILSEATEDLRGVGRIVRLDLVTADEVAVSDVVLAEQPEA